MGTWKYRVTVCIYMRFTEILRIDLSPPTASCEKVFSLFLPSAPMNENKKVMCGWVMYSSPPKKSLLFLSIILRWLSERVDC